MQCSTPVIKPCEPCKHPLEYLFENAYLASLGVENRVSFTETLITILEQGLFIPNCNICCPDCNGIYILASIDKYLEFSSFSLPDIDCCLNIFSGVETSLKIIEAIPNNDKPNICCNTDFNNCFDKLYCWLNKPETSAEYIERLLDKGILEYGVFYDKCNDKSTSGLCYISEFFKKYCNLNLGRSKIEFIEVLLDTGIVVSCEEGRVIVASIDKYLGYLEQIGVQ